MRPEATNDWNTFRLNECDDKFVEPLSQHFEKNIHSFILLRIARWMGYRRSRVGWPNFTIRIECVQIADNRQFRQTEPKAIK